MVLRQLAEGTAERGNGYLGAKSIAILADADVLGDELRAKAAALKDEKQRLLVEREQVRQDLLGSDRDRFDRERLLAALSRFGAVFPKLTPLEQKDLVTLCVSRIEVRAGPAGEEEPGAWQFLVRFKLHVERLVESLEERVVVEHGERPQGALLQRPLVIEPRVVFRSWRRSPSAMIVAPFQAEFHATNPEASIEPAGDDTRICCTARSNGSEFWPRCPR